MRLSLGFGVLVLASLVVLPACDDGDPAPAGPAGTAGSAGAGASSAGEGGSAGTSVGGGGEGGTTANGGATVDATGSYALTFTKSFDSCSDLEPLDPSAGGTLEIQATGGTLVAKFGGWPADQLTPLIGTAAIAGSQEGDEITLKAPPGAAIDVNGCFTQWMVASTIKSDGTAISGALVLSRGASTSATCTDQGIKPCPRSVNFFGKKN